MNDLVIFIVGTGVFAVTTTATLLYGYFSFHRRAESQGIGRPETPPGAASSSPTDPGPDEE
jgi:hypothetical protein